MKLASGRADENAKASKRVRNNQQVTEHYLNHAACLINPARAFLRRPSQNRLRPRVCCL